MSGPKNKEIDDLPRYRDWMTDCARCLVPVAYSEDIAIMALQKAYKPTKPRPPAEDEDRVKAWLWTLLKFEAMSFWRDQTRSLEQLWDNPNDALNVGESVDWETAIINRQLMQVALDDLTEEQRDLVIKCDVDGITLASLARDSGIHEGTLRSRLERAHDLMRAKLIACGEESRRRLGVFVPFWLFGWLFPKDAEACESWTDRIRERLYRVLRQPMQFATSIAAGACIMVFAPHRPDFHRKEVVAIAPEPVISAEPAAAIAPIPVSPGTEVAVMMPAPSQAAKSQQSAPAQNSAKEKDFLLIVQAKAALKRNEPKRALECLAEHERKFPKSENAGLRETLRARAMKALQSKR